MNKNSDALDKWLQKNVTHSSDKPPRKTKPKHKSEKHGKNTHKKRSSRPSRKNRHHKGRPTLRIIPLGGLNEVGKNMMAIEYGRDIVIIDMGLQFPEEDMLGIDYVVPDTSYIEKNKDKIRGVLLTHGHLDHIGAIPYLNPKLGNPTLFGTKLTLGLINKHVKEWGLKGQTKFVTVKPGQKYNLGIFKASFFRVNHSIPDATGIILETPEGILVHTGDFKFDFTPADGVMADMDTIGELANKKVLALLSDSTNSTKPGHTISEKVIGETLDKLIEQTNGRLIIASFSSLIGRMQQIIDSAKKHNRNIFISGRSMVDNVRIAAKLGYIRYERGLVRELGRAKKDARNENALILTTGSQGEPLSALSRMALNEHKHLKINKKDTIIFSSSPIVGNERAITAVVNELARKGAKVINNDIMDVHTSGHGQQEDLKLMISMVKPKYFVPIHGEYYMRKAHAELAKELGIAENKIILAENGSIIEAKNKNLKLSNKNLECGYIMVDSQGGGLSDIANHIISDRQFMAQNGIILTNLVIDKKSKKLVDLSVRARGFVFMKETKRILKDIDKKIRESFAAYLKNKKSIADKKNLSIYLKGRVERMITDQIERHPLIEFIFTEV